jgi:hypothetical protein
MLWLVPLAAVVYVGGQAIAAIGLESLPLERPQLPPSDNPAEQAAWGLASALILAAGLAPLARHLAGRWLARWVVMAAFLYFVNTINTAIELVIFSKFGGQAYLAAFGVLPALLSAAVLTAIRPVRAPTLELTYRQTGSGLAGRLAACWLAFPVVYFIFGALIGPWVIETYLAEDSQIIIPPIGTILAVQAIRSMFYLVPTLAVIERWTGTRRSLWFSLGWAHWALVGLSGLVVPNDFMPPHVRLIHSLEIGADSFAYAAILVALLTSRKSVGGPSRET